MALSKEETRSHPTWKAVFQYATHMKRLNAALPDATELAERLLDVRTSKGSVSLQLPVHCNASQGRVCGLLKQIPALNELLFSIQADVVEVAAGKLAVRLHKGFPLSKYNDKGQNMEEAIIFVHSLISRHDCVDSLEFTLQPRERRDFDELLCDALRLTRLLRSLCISNCCFNSDGTRMAFRTICHLLQHQLTDLALDSLKLETVEEDWLSAFANCLASATILKFLKIVKVYFNRKHRDFVARTMEAVSNNTSIIRLAVDASFLSHGRGLKFKEMLSKTSSLAELTVLRQRIDDMSMSYLAFKAVMKSKSVTKLTVVGFILDAESARALSALMVENHTVQELICASSSWRKNMPMGPEDKVKWHAHSLASGLKNAKSLRRLVVPFDFTVEEHSAILEAAAKCNSLQELRFSRVEPETFVMKPIGDALLEKKNVKVAFGKFCINLCSEYGKPFADFNPHNAATKDLNVFLNPLYGSLGAHSEGFLSSLSLSSLPRHVGTDEIREDVAKGLACYLSYTSNIKQLTLNFSAKRRLARHIVRGLVQNKSIDEIKINSFEMHKEDVALFCDWLKGSRRVHRLALGNIQDEEHSFMETLGAALETGYSLTSIDTSGYLVHASRKMFVKKIAWRNYGLLQCAASFVLGSTLKRAAVAYELVSWHPLLPIAVQRMGYLGAEEASQKICKSSFRLRDEFWQLSGIVKRDLVCNDPPENPGGDRSGITRQIDELDVHALRHLCSFLKVADIIDEDAVQPQI